MNQEPSFCSTATPAILPSRPAIATAQRAGAVEDAACGTAEAARSVLDGAEHSAMFVCQGPHHHHVGEVAASAKNRLDHWWGVPHLEFRRPANKTPGRFLSWLSPIEKPLPGSAAATA